MPLLICPRTKIQQKTTQIWLHWYIFYRITNGNPESAMPVFLQLYFSSRVVGLEKRMALWSPLVASETLESWPRCRHKSINQSICLVHLCNKHSHSAQSNNRSWISFWKLIRKFTPLPCWLVDRPGHSSPVSLFTYSLNIKSTITKYSGNGLKFQLHSPSIGEKRVWACWLISRLNDRRRLLRAAFERSRAEWPDWNDGRRSLMQTSGGIY